LGNTYTQSTTFTRLIAVGLSPSEAASISRLIHRWVICNGEEETVRRLKQLKDCYLHHLVGQKVHLDWFKQSKDGAPKGPFRVLWKFGRKHLFKVWNAIMSYSSFTYSGDKIRMTPRQYAKFITSVNRKKVNQEYNGTMEVLINNFTSAFTPLFPFKAETGAPVAFLKTSPSRRAPNPQGYMKNSPEEETLVSSIGVLALRPKFTRKHMRIYSGVLSGFEDTWTGFAWTMDNSTAMPLSGRIGIIQEPGYKARTVANPYRVHQAAMLPLKEYLFGLLRQLPNDYVYNQEAGLMFVQEQLRQGKTCYSIDLSNASDNLPLQYQKVLLSKLGIPQYWIDAFSDISSGDWELPPQWVPKESDTMRYVKPEDVREEGLYPYNSERFLRWSVGQPLGLGPSFPSAFLLHHAIVIGIHVLLQLPLDYAQVGDDLTLFNKDVYDMYRWVMSGIGVPVSLEKTLVSNKAGEFLSRIVFPDFILRGYKWKGSGDNSFWEVARNLGPRSIRLFQYRQRRVLKSLAPLPEPYGLGWNPQGLPYWDRLEEWLEALSKEVPLQRSFVTAESSLNFRLYTGNLKFITDKGYPVSAIPEQGIEGFVANQINPTVAQLGQLMIPNLDYLARLFDDVKYVTSYGAPDIDLEAVMHFLRDFTVMERVSELTTLIRLERIIQAVKSRER